MRSGNDDKVLCSNGILKDFKNASSFNVCYEDETVIELCPNNF